MSPIRQQLLDAIDQAPDIDLEAMLQFLQSRRRLAIAEPVSAAQQAWNQVVNRLDAATPEQYQQQRQAVAEMLQAWNDEDADPEAPEESWESLKAALDQNRDSYRPLFL
jgi:parvulin-like peptidyl-prolyl isomerase